MGVCVFVGFLNFAIEFLWEKEKSAKPFLPVHMGPMLNLLSEKNGQKSCDTVPLRYRGCRIDVGGCRVNETF